MGYGTAESRDFPAAAAPLPLVAPLAIHHVEQ
jgi:hypothetical protein